ncbi:hypothetical protein BGZ80_002360 [Entomortierella chlamydospora]|uniref:RRM domain-containing protein n=1 Tax=Entomortierella chlamydospora TaxID=101097 RepID=A0A9P6T348_9FUNG|nr:hypothetical protein BGZ79_000761 [Entomortierella chlamydospora]KAG0021443.1 hypothetical protein BGZ80_002360 [Entomortierella chlamydospora]
MSHGNRLKNHGTAKKTDINTPKRTIKGRVAKSESFPITGPVELTTKSKAKHIQRTKENTKPTQLEIPQTKPSNPLPRYEQSSSYSSDVDDLESIYEPLTYSSDSASNSDGPLTPPTTFSEALSEPDAMDIDSDKISFRRENIISQELSIKNEESPVTIEIENLDPCTSADDVKMVCGRFGNIKSCICSGGYAQVTYTNEVDALKAIKALHGKGTDNVTRRSTPVIHSPPLVVAVYFPSPIAERMKLPTISREQMLDMKNNTNMIEGSSQSTNLVNHNYRNYKNYSRKGARNFRRATQA